MSGPRTAAVFLASSLLALAAVDVGAASGPAGVGWPPSSGLLVAEIVTGGASASDEYVEITNAGPAAADLAGYELVYVTASGATTTRKASWATPLTLAPGRHLLLANVSGAYAALADATYSGGLSADGGSVVLRQTGGAVIDAVGWGTAVNSFVEGFVAPAPPAGSSLERLPGGPAGNTQDTNDNSGDFFVQAQPAPQPLAAPPAPPAPEASPSTSPPGDTHSPEPTGTTSPAPATDPPATSSAGPSADATATPSSTIEPSATLTPPPTDGPTPSIEPTETPAATLEPPPTDAPSPTESAAPTETPAPSTEATPTPSPTEAPSPTAAPSQIAFARAAAIGTPVVIEAVLTTSLGACDAGRGAFVQDATGGIALWLPAIAPAQLLAGTFVRVSGTVDDRYSERTIRVDDGGVAVLGVAELPEAVALATGSADETLEGSRVALTGFVTGAPDQLADGTGLWLDDGSGAGRVVATTAAIDGLAVGSGTELLVVGPLGQHASGTSLGYRVLATEPGSLVVLAVVPEPSPTLPPETPAPTLPPATPTPATPTPATPTPATPTPAPTASPTPAGPSPSASPSASAAPTPPPLARISIAEARLQPVKAKVRVGGVVTAGPGALVPESLVAIDDGTGGMFVRLAAAMPELREGVYIEAVGSLAAPYGQLEIRGIEWLALGDEGEATSTAVDVTQVGESVEARVVTVSGLVSSVKVTDEGEVTATLTSADADLRVFARPRATLVADDLPKGAKVTLTGVVGQRSSKTGVLDGYRLWLRSPDDVFVNTAPVVTPTPTRTPHKTAGPTAAPVTTLEAARATTGTHVAVDAVVTVAPGLVRQGTTALVVDDGTAAIAVQVGPDAGALRVGDRVHVEGTSGTWRGQARLAPATIATLAGRSAVEPRPLGTQALSGLEWRLVETTGRIERVTRSGLRWSLLLNASGRPIVVVGEEGAGIGSAALAAGRQAVVIGVLRRSSSDPSTFQLLPRSPADLRVLSVARSSSGAPLTNRAAPAAVPSGEATLRLEIDELPGRAGSLVTVAGLVVDVTPASVTLDDGTGTLDLVAGNGSYPSALPAVGPAAGGTGQPAIQAAEELALLEIGDAVEVTGIVEGAPAGEPGLRLRVLPGTILELADDGLASTPAPTLYVPLLEKPSVDVDALGLRQAPAIGSTAPVTPLAALMAGIALAVGLLLARRRRPASLRAAARARLGKLSRRR